MMVLKGNLKMEKNLRFDFIEQNVQSDGYLP